MRKTLIGLFLVSGALPAAAQVSDMQWNNCANPAIVASARINACTKIIKSGQLSSVNMASIYLDRGIAYDDMRLYDLAIADYTKVIALRPDFSEGYNGRAWIYHEKGEDAKGLADAHKAVSLERTPNHLATLADITAKLGQNNNATAKLTVPAAQPSNATADNHNSPLLETGPDSFASEGAQ